MHEIDSQLLLSEISSSKYVKASELALKFSVSEKTIRNRIKAINSNVAENGASILSKPGYGYLLVVSDTALYDSFIGGGKHNEALPGTSSERSSYILSVLLEHGDFVKLDDLSRQMYVSKNSITADLKKAEKNLSLYNLKLIRKPHHGIKVAGKEFNVRLCIANFLVKRGLFFSSSTQRPKMQQEMQQEIKKIGEFTLAAIQSKNIKLSETLLQNLILHIYVAAVRTRKGCGITYDTESFAHLFGENELEASRQIAQSIENAMQVTFSEDEILYIAIHLSGKRSIFSNENSNTNVVILPKIQELVDEMIKSIYDIHKIDFRDNLELRLAISQHLIPLDVRLTYDMSVSNPLLSQIKGNYKFAYTLAIQACIPLSLHYGKELSEDEIGYFALLFALELEREKSIRPKKNVLVVCPSGKASSQLLAYSFKEKFKDYVENIYVCDFYGIDDFDFLTVDCVFTTMPINKSVPVPIFELDQFLDEKGSNSVRTALIVGSKEFLYDYYDEALFFNNIKGTTKEQVLVEMCTRLEAKRKLPDGFLSAVLKREALANTDFGNMSALPHPFKTITAETFVCVGILDKPIKWTKNMVQLVFLVSVSYKEDQNLQNFYRLTTNFLLDEAAPRELLSKKTFKVLMQLLCRDLTE